MLSFILNDRLRSSSYIIEKSVSQHANILVWSVTHVELLMEMSKKDMKTSIAKGERLYLVCVCPWFPGFLSTLSVNAHSDTNQMSALLVALAQNDS